jgi:hypothetical protein
MLALLYSLTAGEPFALHPCPMHEPAAAALVAAAQAGQLESHGSGQASAHGAGHQAAGHTTAADHSSAHAASPHSSGPQHGDHQCDCIGSGTCSAPAALASTPQQARWFAIITRQAEPPAGTSTVRADATEHLLPFANGPPAVA